MRYSECKVDKAGASQKEAKAAFCIGMSTELHRILHWRDLRWGLISHSGAVTAMSPIMRGGGIHRGQSR
ncbi:MAG: hypothetical protein HQL31_13220 [Planctomycetes bacterium]|nr:hypothetical protein [Planctomycetota bacterium]